MDRLTVVKQVWLGFVLRLAVYPANYIQIYDRDQFAAKWYLVILTDLIITTIWKFRLSEKKMKISQVKPAWRLSIYPSFSVGKFIFEVKILVTIVYFVYKFVIIMYTADNITYMTLKNNRSIDLHAHTIFTTYSFNKSNFLQQQLSYIWLATKHSFPSCHKGDSSHTTNITYPLLERFMHSSAEPRSYFYTPGLTLEFILILKVICQRLIEYFLLVIK
jgi:hypothetical protein